jgi:hypothetical protein
LQDTNAPAYCQALSVVRKIIMAEGLGFHRILFSTKEKHQNRFKNGGK